MKNQASVLWGLTAIYAVLMILYVSLPDALRHGVLTGLILGILVGVNFSVFVFVAKGGGR